MEHLFIYIGQSGLRAKDDHMANGKGTQVGTAEREEEGKGGMVIKIQTWCKEKRAPPPQPLPGLPGSSEARCKTHGTSLLLVFTGF